MTTIATIVEGHGEVKALPFLAAAASLPASGHFTEPEPVDAPERRRGAKETVARRLGSSYKEVLHQPRLTGAMDLDEAAHCKWFSKFRRDVLSLAGVPQ